jgi:hypothetical protein
MAASILRYLILQPREIGSGGRKEGSEGSEVTEVKEVKEEVK